MAETFGDKEAAEKILKATTLQDAEKAMKAISGFDENAWAPLKLQHWEDGQRLKIEQVRWIQNLLVYSGKVYFAVSSQDKKFGTGWRKGREESAQPRWWDGENAGGKALMRMRDQLKTGHKWMGPNEEQETEKKYNELKKNTWRRQRNESFGGRGDRKGMRGGRGRSGGFPQKSRGGRGNK